MASNVKKETQVTKTSDWKKASVGAPLELPSGKVARVKRISIQYYLKTGKIPNVLMKPIQQALAANGAQAENLDDQAIAKVLQDPNALNDLFAMVDMISCDAFVEPKLHPTPEDNNDRDEELVYVDEVDIEDKMFVFQWMVGGTSDLEAFRTEQSKQLGTVPSS